MTAARPRVAIAGGSLGGLTAALLLRDLGCQVDVFERSAAELESRGAGLVGGERVVCGLLVGADGIGSLVRRRLLPEVAASYAGYVAWRGTIDERALSPATRERLADAITYQMLPQSHILVYPIPGLGGSV